MGQGASTFVPKQLLVFNPLGTSAHLKDLGRCKQLEEESVQPISGQGGATTMFFKYTYPILPDLHEVPGGYGVGVASGLDFRNVTSCKGKWLHSQIMSFLIVCLLLCYISFSRRSFSFSQFSTRCKKEWVSVTSSTGKPITFCGSDLPKPMELMGGNITVTHHFLPHLFPVSAFCLGYIRGMVVSLVNHEKGHSKLVLTIFEDQEL